jgi:hypothetical protein
MKTPWVKIAAFCLLVGGCNSTHPAAPSNPPSSERSQDQGQDNGEKSPPRSTVARPEGTTTVPITKPKLKVAADGLPSGHDTPEGAACDLARAFINRDAALFSNTCVRLYGGDKGPEDYAAFLKSTVEGFKQEAARKDPSPSGPKSIGKVFAARHLTRNGPASYGYAAFKFQDIMFVDVGCLLHNGERCLNRTMVIKDE